MQTEPPAITPSSHPYDALTPEVILDAIEAEGFEVNGRLFALNSYE
ncbi:MAG TPA: stress response kinase A, partial [Marinobacter hydrocarbonoclasticus]|nr:stress response kinase A [Marinobacter nauticus]